MGIFSKKEKDKVLSEIKIFRDAETRGIQKRKNISSLNKYQSGSKKTIFRKNSSLKPFSPDEKHYFVLRKVLISIIALIIIIGGIFIYRITSVGQGIFSNEGSFWGQVKELVFGGDKELKTKNDQTNILIIGIGGEEHQGGELADTIIVAAIKEKEKKVALLSIPRDLYIKVPGENYYTKINAIHAFGEAKEKGSGPKEMVKIIEEATGLPIHYYGRIDFIAFKQIIDELGGIDITIEESFYDYWHKISFMKGTEHMNGERALAYVRARYVEGPQGGDIARGKRTQQVLQAIGEKGIQIPIWDIKTANNIIGTLGNHAKTNLHLSQLKHLYELSKQIDKNNIINVVMNSGPGGILMGTTENIGGQPASILKTRTGDYSEIRKLAENLFQEAPDFNKVSPTPQKDESASAEASTSASATADKEEKATLEIRNGTTTLGFAAKISEIFKKEGYVIENIGNAANQNYEKTIICDFTAGKKPASLKDIENKLGISNIKTSLPAEELQSKANFVIILGADITDKF